MEYIAFDSHKRYTFASVEEHTGAAIIEVAPIAFTSLTAGWRHACGETSSNATYCWGANFSGQLGDGTTEHGISPVRVSIDQPLTSVSASGVPEHSCGVDAGGAAYCWGANGAGQLGDGTTNDRYTPSLVSGGLSFVALSCGSYHTCGITVAGVAYCWGDNNAGQLGDGTTNNSLVPVRVVQ